MVAHVEVLPAIGMLDWEEFLGDPIEDLVKLLFFGPRGLLLSSVSFDVGLLDRVSVLLEVLERFTLK